MSSETGTGARHKPTSSTATSSTLVVPIYTKEMEKKRMSVASALYTDETGPAVSSPESNSNRNSTSRDPDRDPEKGEKSLGTEEGPTLHGHNRNSRDDPGTGPNDEEIDDGRPTMTGKRLAVLVAYVTHTVQITR